MYLPRPVDPFQPLAAVFSHSRDMQWVSCPVSDPLAPWSFLAARNLVFSKAQSRELA